MFKKTSYITLIFCMTFSMQAVDTVETNSSSTTKEVQKEHVNHPQITKDKRAVLRELLKRTELIGSGTLILFGLYLAKTKWNDPNFNRIWNCVGLVTRSLD